MMFSFFQVNDQDHIKASPRTPCTPPITSAPRDGLKRGRSSGPEVMKLPDAEGNELLFKIYGTGVCFIIFWRKN